MQHTDEHPDKAFQDSFLFVVVKTISFKHHLGKFYMLIHVLSKREIKISYCKKVSLVFMYARNLGKNDLFTRIEGNGLLIHQL